MTEHERPPVAPLVAAGTSAATAVTAATAAACCVGPITAPLVVAAFGASGTAWLAGLKPFVPYILAVALLALVYAFRSIRREQRACVIQTVSRFRRMAARASVVVLWLSATLWLGAALTYFMVGRAG